MLSRRCSTSASGWARRGVWIGPSAVGDSKPRALPLPETQQHPLRDAEHFGVVAPVDGGRGGRGGGRGPVTPFSAGGAAIVSAANLKVLTAQNVEISMQNITFALGVGCIYCHDLNDLSLDTKPQKVKARMMLEMVRDVNAKFGDGKTHVTCWTCHHASTTPQIAKQSSN